MKTIHFFSVRAGLRSIEKISAAALVTCCALISDKTSAQYLQIISKPGNCQVNTSGDLFHNSLFELEQSSSENEYWCVNEYQSTTTTQYISG